MYAIPNSTIVHEREAYVCALKVYDQQVQLYDRQMHCWKLRQHLPYYETDDLAPVPPVKPARPAYLSYPTQDISVSKPVVLDSPAPIPCDDLPKFFKNLLWTTPISHRDTQYDFSSDDSDDDETVWGVPEEKMYASEVLGDNGSYEDGSMTSVALGSLFQHKTCASEVLLPVCQSEVLGPSANAWAESDEMLCGGVRSKRKKGRARTGGRRKGMNGGMGRGVMGSPQVVFNRGRDYAPSRMRTHLDFDFRFTAPFATVASPYALDVIVATNPNNFTQTSTPVPGFLELAGLYRKYRTNSAQFRYETLNNDSFGIEMFICPVNFLPSVATDPTRYLSQGVSRRKLVSGKGGIDHGALTISTSVKDFGGSSSTSVEDPYVGSTDNTSPPSDNFYFLYGFLTNGSATVTQGLNVIHLRVNIDFFELQTPAT